MKRLTTAALVLVSLVLAQAAPKATTTVAQIRAKPVNSQKVILSGQIVSRSGDTAYRFADSTGEVGVGSRQRLELPLGAKVTLEGQVALDPLGGLEVDLLRVWLPDGRVLVVPR